MDRVGQQISVTAGANEGCAAAIWRKPPQNEWKDKQAVMPERTDVIFRNRFADNPRLVIYFVAQRSRPKLQKPKSERDQPSREPAFNLQCFLRFAGTLFSPQRYV